MITPIINLKDINSILQSKSLSELEAAGIVHQYDAPSNVRYFTTAYLISDSYLLSLLTRLRYTTARILVGESSHEEELVDLKSATDTIDDSLLSYNQQINYRFNINTNRVV